MIVRGRRVILAFEFFREPCVDQALANRRFLRFQSGRQGDISI
jgi:hypothetical protein